MTDDEFKARVVALLEIIAFGDEPEGCQHERATDMGVMGMRPGERMKCNDCGEMFSRVTEAI